MNTDIDQNIERVLTGLRHTAPTTDLEARIHQHLAQTTTANPQRLSFPAVILSIAKDPRIVFGSSAGFAAVTAATCAVIALLMLLTHPPRTQPSSANGTSQPAIVIPTTPTGNPAPDVRAVALASHRATNWVARRPNVRSDAPTLIAEVAPAPDLDAIALAETLTPSHPAPPMPLTRQEYLILTILRSGDQPQIAELDPAEREAALNRDRAEFNQFFQPLPPTSSTGDPK
jgi:hypothetical protein